MVDVRTVRLNILGLKTLGLKTGRLKTGRLKTVRLETAGPEAVARSLGTDHEAEKSRTGRSGV
jgi:hypothetical protein